MSVSAGLVRERRRAIARQVWRNRRHGSEFACVTQPYLLQTFRCEADLSERHASIEHLAVALDPSCFEVEPAHAIEDDAGAIRLRQD